MIPDTRSRSFIAAYAQDLITTDTGNISYRHASPEDLQIFQSVYQGVLPSKLSSGFVVTYLNVLKYSKFFEVRRVYFKLWLFSRLGGLF